MSTSPQELQALQHARDRTRLLLEDLLRQLAELDASPPSLPDGSLQAGRLALQRAIDAARRMAESIDAAIDAALNRPQ